MQWLAIYEDGTEIKEGDVDSTEKIDRDKLKEFRLYKDDKLVFVSFFSKDRKLIFRRRVTVKASGVQSTVYLIGWHQNINGSSIKSICYVYEDGHIEFDDSRNDLQLVPCEEF